MKQSKNSVLAHAMMYDMILQVDVMLMGIFRRGCGALQVRRICLLQDNSGWQFMGYWPHNELQDI
jgi:hypothetical protein